MDKKELAKNLLAGITCRMCHYYIKKTCYNPLRLINKKPGPNNMCNRWGLREHSLEDRQITDRTIDVYRLTRHSAVKFKKSAWFKLYG